MDLGFFYNEAKLKPNLKMAVHRIQIYNNKKSAQVKHAKREISELLKENKDEWARIRVEHIIHAPAVLKIAPLGIL